MQQRTFIDSRKPVLTPSAAFKRRRKMRLLCGAIAAALTATAVIRA